MKRCLIVDDSRVIRRVASKIIQDLGFDVEEPDSALPDARGWFDGLSAGDQDQVLGKGRGAAFRRGDLGWDDLSVRRENPDWRACFVMPPLN